MSKRARSSSSSLTGGTGDVNPQLFKFPSLVDTAASIQTAVINTPIPAFNLGQNDRAVVMEVLKIFFQADTTYATSINPSKARKYWMIIPGNPAGLAGGDIRSQWAFAPCLAAFAAEETIGQTNQTNSVPGVHSPMTYEMDMTDGQGHGILLATPTVTFARDVEITGGATISTSTFTSAMLYRFKEVSLTEYMGIIQSQTRPV